MVADDERSRHIPEIPRSNPLGEILLGLSKATLASIPAGASVASLVSDYLNAAKFSRFELFLDRVRSDLEELEQKIDVDYVKTEDFSYLAEQCLKGGADQPQEAKRSAFRGILVNSALNQTTAEEEREYFLGLVDRFSSLQLRILKFMAQPEAYLRQVGIPKLEVGGNFNSMFQRVFPGVSRETLMGALDELHRYGLVGSGKDMFNAMTSGSGLPLLQGRVTAHGREFIRFCTSPVE